MEIQYERDNVIWNVVKDFLLVHKKDLHLEFHDTNPPCGVVGINAVYWRMVCSAQNRSMMPSVIKFDHKKYPEQASKWQRILFDDFSPKRVIAEYAENPDRLWDAVYAEFGQNALRNDNGKKGKLLELFLLALVDCAEYLRAFDFELTKLQKFLKEFPEPHRFAIPHIISSEIHGFGYALACDFLKECEALDFDIVKPDIHIRDFLFTIDHQKYSDPQIVKRMHQFARNVGPIGFDDLFKWRNVKTGDDYKLDKIIWLLSNDENKLKKDFLELLKGI